MEKCAKIIYHKMSLYVLCDISKRRILMKKKILSIFFIVMCLSIVFVLASCGSEEYEPEYMYFGEYPQTIKAQDVTITENQNEKGYFLGSDGEYYAQVVAAPCDKENYKFSNGEKIVEGETYYFKVEPIRWKVITKANGTAFVVCDTILANQSFDAEKNEYDNSDIREWLNEEFYKTAFSEPEKNSIKKTIVNEDSKESDKVFLLSDEEAKNEDLLFSTKEKEQKYDVSRQMSTSDYARATGVWMTINEDYYGNGFWWLRSPASDSDQKAQYIYYDGYMFSGGIKYDYIGVVPALNINID